MRGRHICYLRSFGTVERLETFFTVMWDLVPATFARSVDNAINDRIDTLVTVIILAIFAFVAGAILLHPLDLI
jgi:hypothetical protein